MPTRIKSDGDYAVELSTYIVACTFLSEENQEVIPTEVKWSLKDADGAEVNGRTDVSETPAATVNIVLSGDDLALSANFAGESELRKLVIKAKYNSTLGAGLPLNDELTFPVVNLAAAQAP